MTTPIEEIETFLEVAFDGCRRKSRRTSIFFAQAMLNELRSRVVEWETTLQLLQNADELAGNAKGLGKGAQEDAAPARRSS
jgi:hypothetical protein